jgi:hypothetical protein
MASRKRNRDGSVPGPLDVQLVPDPAHVKVIIPPPNIKGVSIRIRGTSPLVINKMSARVRKGLQEGQEEGSTTKSRKKRTPKDFKLLYEEAKHIADEGWCGIHAAAFRNASIDACRTVSLTMTSAKLALFVRGDGLDNDTMEPLVKITKGEPRMWIAPTRNATGVVDMRSRPMWKPGWEALVKMIYDADMLRDEDVINLMARAGMQVGIGEGRPNSKKSYGLGFGLFEIVA